MSPNNQHERNWTVRIPPTRSRRFAALVASSVLVVACHSGGSKHTTSGGTSVVTTASIATTATSPSSSSTSVLSCATSVLAGSLGQPGAAAGTVYYHLLFRNTSSAPCTLGGYPGVSFVDS